MQKFNFYFSQIFCTQKSLLSTQKHFPFIKTKFRKFRPDADVSGLNLTPSEKIYFRYFGPPGSSDTHAGESGSSTPLPNGLNDANQQLPQGEQNGVSFVVVGGFCCSNSAIF
jgi:hypothetical protein